MELCIITAHAGADSIIDAIHSWTGVRLHDIPKTTLAVVAAEPMVTIVNGAQGMLPAYDYGFHQTSSEILAYLHDDTIINDPDWVQRILKEFEDPTVGLVGFGGATRHGDPGMYRKPYEYQQLARAGFASNMVDAENHGERFTGSCDVAVLDGFALIVRREVLEKCRYIPVTGVSKKEPGVYSLETDESAITSGWPLDTPIGYACYDYWLSCMTRRLGYRIRLVGVPCQHLGGQTFVKLGIGRDPRHWQQYVDSHRYIYDEFKDVLPYEVPR